MEKIKAKLIKRKDIRDEFRKTFLSAYTDEGYVLDGYFTEWPEVGSNFKFHEFSDELHEYFPLTTTFIVEMIDHRTFRTKNSIYELITLVDERDEKINDLLK
jgi:hypothetical protein